MDIWDCHTHITGNGLPNLGYSKKSVEKAKEELKRADIKKAVTFPLLSSEQDMKEVNQKFAKKLKGNREFFVPFCSIDPTKEECIKELKRGINQLNFKGVKLHPLLCEFYPNSKEFEPLYEEINKLNVPIMFHSGALGADKIPIKYCDPIYIDEVSSKYPEIPIICAHMGWPWHEKMLAISQEKENVYFDTAGWRIKYIPQRVKTYTKVITDKILFGTDYPAIEPNSAVSDLKNEFTTDIASRIGGENLRKILDL